ncbi:MAG: protein-glutamate O-methyltransferase CheR [Myxococcales bacterium]|nr:protein-glutamate O-methyltransferase CheR [Myxococcales bacterium]
MRHALQGHESLSAAQFRTIQRLLHDVSGIALADNKQSLVHARLGRRLRALKLPSITEYIEFLKGDEQGTSELLSMIDVLTTNKTSFFRERAHFDFLTELLPHWNRLPEVRIWSAGCSSGQEPYSFVMHLAEEAATEQLRRTRVLATDISRPVLEQARRGSYRRDAVRGVPPPMLARYFESRDGPDGHVYRLRDRYRSAVSFARLNLVGQWPMRGPFQLISCRNVMIYFDAPTRAAIASRFRQLLAPGGYLFVGHAETLGSDPRGYELILPAVYRRAD